MSVKKLSSDVVETFGLVLHPRRTYTFTSNALAPKSLTPNISSITPSSGTIVGGTSVTINGANFRGATSVTFAGVAVASFTVVNSGQITCTTGAASTTGSGDVVVTTPSGIGTLAGGWTYTFSPSDLANLFAWWRGDLGITLNGSAVSQWNDQSGNGDANRNLVQSTVAQQPTFNSTDSNFNNQPSVSTNGSSTWLKSGTFSSALAQPSTHYFAAYATVASAGEYSFGGAAAARNAVLQSASSNWGIYAGSAEVDTSVSMLTPSIVCVVFNGASSAIYVDRYNTTAATGNPGASSLTEMTVGGLDNSGALLAGGPTSVAEYAAYSVSHGTSNRQDVMQYMGLRYGITVTA